MIQFRFRVTWEHFLLSLAELSSDRKEIVFETCQYVKVAPLCLWSWGWTPAWGLYLIQTSECAANLPWQCVLVHVSYDCVIQRQSPHGLCSHLCLSLFFPSNSVFNNSHSCQVTHTGNTVPATWTWTVQSLQQILDILYIHSRASLGDHRCFWQFWASRHSNIWAYALFIELSHPGRVGLRWKLTVESNLQ